MSCDRPAQRDGFSTLLGTSESDALHVQRVYTNRVNQIQAGPAMGAISITLDAMNHPQVIAAEYDRPDGTQTITWTLTRDSECHITAVSEGVLT